MTLPEVLLWRELKTRPQGLKFRRQSPAGPFVLDFYCESARLAVEVDGAVHGQGDNPARDERRDRYFARAGIRTYRVPADEVFHNMDGVIQAIVQACSPEQTPPPGFAWSPSPPGRIAE
jgi:very-short-patch-repair endonuclease